MAGPVSAAPDFQLTVSPKTVFLAPNGTVNLTIGATGLDGFSSPLTLTAMGLPTGVTAAFSPNPLVLPGTSTLTLTAGAGLVAEDFNVNIAATGGGITHFALNGVNVLDFDLKPVVVDPPPCQGTIHGKLTNSETGAPIANSHYRIGFFRGTTDANGDYGPLSYLPGDQQFLADEVPGYWEKRQPVTFVCNQSTRLDYALLPWHPATVFGKVVEGTPSPTDSTVVIPTTTPISGIEVRLEDAIPSTGAPSAADGSYTMNVPYLGQDNTPLSNVRIVPIAPDVKGYWPRSSRYPSPIPIGDLAPFENKHADVALVRQCFGKISGTVTYGDTGLPAAGVQVVSSHSFAEHHAVTAANGTYSIDKALLGYNNIPVDHSVFAFVSDTHPRYYYYYTSEAGKTHFDACGAQRVVNLVLPPVPMGHIEGHVYDDNGAIVANAPIGIDAFGCHPCLHDLATSDANGYYKIRDIPAPSTWPVRYFDQFKTPFWTSPAISVSVTAGHTTVHDVHIVRKKFASVSGTVRNAITGAAIQGADVVETSAQEDPAPSTSTAPNGNYLLGSIALTGPDNSPRAVTVGYSADGYWDHEEALTVEKDKPPYARNVDLIPVCRGVVVTGVVRHAVTGAPIPFAIVETDQRDIVQADANGAYRFENVDVGSKNSPTELEITAHANNFQSQTKTIEIFCGAKVAVGSPGTIEIEKATEPSGDPTLFQFDGGLGKFSLADGDIKTVNSLFPGTYDVTETPVAGWQLREVSCNDEPMSADEDGLVSIDVGPGETMHCLFTNSRPGTIVIKKETHPDGDPASFEFFGPEDDPFTLGDGQSHTISGLTPGTHTISEELTGPWEVEGITCDDDDSGVDPEGVPSDVIVELAAGETVTCTFTNRRVPTGTIVIKKETDPDGQLATFDFFGPDDEFSIADGESHEIADLPVGTYDVSEFFAEGWEIDRVECDDDDSGTEPDIPETATINLAANETVTCTFFNKKLPVETGILVVKKTTDPANDPTEFSFSSQELGEFVIAGGGSETFTDLTPGVYGLSETDVEGWTQGSATCDDDSPVDAVDLAAGETVTCTFHNVRNVATGTIIIAKTTNPSPDATATSFGFTAGGGLSPSTFNLANGATQTFSGLAAGAAYSVAEGTTTGWRLASATCSDGSPVTKIDLAAGETVTCTFVNDKLATLIVRKTTNPSPDTTATSFGFTTGGGLTPTSFNLINGGTQTFSNVTPGSAYSVAEGAAAGWRQASATCSDGSPITKVDLAAGETVTCTFVNEKLATLIVKKTTEPSPDPSATSFGFTAGGGLSPSTFSLANGGTRTFSNVTPGSGYTIAEGATAGWQLASATCDDGSQVTNIGLAPGETVTCTFVNRPARGTIIIKKQTQPAGSTVSFGFTRSWGAGFNLSDGQTATFGDLPAGSGYRVAETATAGWKQASATCSDSSPITNINLAPGESVTCTFVNQRVALATGAHTIGFWHNKNGQGIITSGATVNGACASATWLRQFAPFQDLAARSTCAQVAAYDLTIFKAASAGGTTMNPMLKAQMLATAFSVFFSDPALGGNKLGAAAPIGGVKIDLKTVCIVTDKANGDGTCGGKNEDVSPAFGGASSMTVTQALTYAASKSNVGGSTWYANVKATQALAKDLFDAINNNVAFGAP